MSKSKKKNKEIKSVENRGQRSEKQEQNVEKSNQEVFEKHTDVNNFFDTVVTVSYPKTEVQEMLENNEACVVESKEGNELYQIGVAGRVGYVRIASPGDCENQQHENAVYCANVVACYKCFETFYYHFAELLVILVDSHMCSNSCVDISTTDSEMSLSNCSDGVIPVIYPHNLPKIVSKITDTKNVIQRRECNLYRNLKRYYTLQIFTDMTVVCEKQSIKCHKLVLCAYSVYFEELLGGCCSEEQHPLVYITDLKFWQVKALIDFMYTGKLEIEENRYNLLDKAVDVLKFRTYLIPVQLICYRLKAKAIS